MKPISLVLILLALTTLSACWESNLDTEYGQVPCTDQHCELCDVSQTNCTQCDTGYVLKEEATECLSCDSQINACQLCTIDLNE